MIYLEKSFASAAKNVAYEQALLDFAESSALPLEILRIWRPEQYFVVVGRGGKVNDDVYLERCQIDQIPVIRRCSGGGTIITGPGCLMYTLILSTAADPALRDISFCHRFIGEQLQQAYSICGLTIERRGHSDLCFGEKKLSGNAMRLGRTHVIYHGTLLIDFDLELLPKYLKLPPRRPEYRNGRSHQDFVMNLKVDDAQLIGALRTVFKADESLPQLTELELDELLKSRYENSDWNLRF